MLRDLELAERATAPDPVPRDPVELAQEWADRATLYRLLSGAFTEEPSAAFLDSVRSPALLQSLEAAGIRFGADFLQPDLPTLTEQLACEYATLFASSGGFPPVESVRTLGRYKQDPHFQTTEWYARCGFAVTGGRFEVFPDHLGVELAFVAELLERGAAALRNADHSAWRTLDKEIKRFWALHPGRWVRGYGRLVARASNASFYRQMGVLLEGFAEEEIVALGLRIDDLDQGRSEIPKAEIRLEFDPNEPVCGACDVPAAMSAPTPGQRVIPLRSLEGL